MDSQIFKTQLQGSKPIGSKSSLCHLKSIGKLWPPKIAEVQTMGILGLPLGTKCHLDVAPVERCKKNYKKEGDGFPQVWAVMNLVSSKLPVVHPSFKSVQIMH
jgi:hypothetical protein